MDKKRLDYYRKKLEAKREELQHMMALAEQEGRAADDATQDIADRAANSYTKEFLLSLSDMERRDLNRVEQALARLRRGEYGTCVDCAKPIGDKRLQAIPWTPLCIQCQELRESRSQPA